LREIKFTSEGRLLTGLLVIFLVMAVFATIDIVSDLREGTTLSHVFVEGVILGVGLFGVLLITRTLVLTMRKGERTAEEVRSLANQLEATAADAARWRNQARALVAGLGEAIDGQFDRWQLSEAEKEVGLLLLKGLSHKEIAAARSVTEATARQQARAVYKKAGLSGRHDLAAFFLEDLMVPARKPDESQPVL